MDLAAAPPVAAAPPTRTILRDAVERPWVSNTKVGDSTLGAVAGRALQFQLEGSGAPSKRELVPQSQAAAKLLEGPGGAKLEQALRGILATTDAHDGRTNVAGISLARGVRDFAVNSALTYLERGDVKGWDPTGGAVATKALDEALDGGREVAKLAVAQAPGWINLGPFASRQLLRLTAADGPSSVQDSRVGAWLSSLAAHEPHHTVTPPRTADIVHGEYLQDPLPKELEARQKADPFVSLKPLNWIEEGTADVLSTWAGVLPSTAAKLGIPSLAELPDPAFPEDFDVIMAIQSAAGRGNRFTPEERIAVDAFNADQFGVAPRSDLDRMQMAGMALGGLRNYPTHVEGLHRLLGLAGLDPASPKDFSAASDLLQGARITHVPGRLADAIIARHELDPGRREQLRTAIRDAGEHVMTDPAAFSAAIGEIAASIARD